MTEADAFIDWIRSERGNISVQDAWLERASRDRGVELAKLILETDENWAMEKSVMALSEQILKDAE